MASQSAPAIKTAGVIGAGTIGAGWAARFLAQGLDVIATDFFPEAEAELRAAIDRAWPALEKLGLLPGASRDRLVFTTGLAELCGTAQFIQLSQPKNHAGLAELLGSIEATASAETIIATDAGEGSGAQPGEGARHPERILIARAMDPVYLLPLVEVAGLPMTAEDTMEKALAFYRWVGMHPVRVSKPTPEGLAGRLWAALQSEARALVDEGLLTAEAADEIVAHGPGLHWTIHGAFPASLERAEDQASQLQRYDEAILGVMQSLRVQNLASGRMIERIETRRYTDRRLPKWAPGAEIGRPLQLLRITADPRWIDYNGHMTESSYLTAFGDASDALFRYIGIDEAYRSAGYSFYTVETHINYYREVGAGAALDFMTQLLGLDEKRLHLFHRMVEVGTGTQVATTEQMLLHVDMKAARVSRIRPDVFQALQAIRDAHQVLPVPAQVGRQMKLKGG